MTLAQSFDGFTGLSPPLLSHSQSPEHPQLGLFDADDLAEDQDQFLDEKPAPSTKKSNGRKGPGAADKRATHNAIERARRESLNGRFMTLAEALPSMAKVKRPSKSVIVQNALSFVYDAQVKEHALIRENNDLRRQVDQLRRQLGMAPLPPPAPLTGSTSTGGSDDGLSAGMGALEAHSPINGGQLVSPAPSFPSPPSSEGHHQQLSPSFAPSSVPHQQQQQQQAFGLFSTPSAPSDSTQSPTSTAVVGSPFSDHLSHSSDLERRHSFATAAALPSPTPQQQHQPAFSHQQQQQAMMLLQAQAQQAQFGYLNPALLSQAHLIAAQMAQQQQQGGGLGFGNVGGGQQQQGGAVNPFDLYGMSGLGAPQQNGHHGGQQWGGFVGQQGEGGGFGAFV